MNFDWGVKDLKGIASLAPCLAHGRGIEEPLPRDQNNVECSFPHYSGSPEPPIGHRRTCAGADRRREIGYLDVWIVCSMAALAKAAHQF